MGEKEKEKLGNYQTVQFHLRKNITKVKNGVYFSAK